MPPPSPYRIKQSPSRAKPSPARTKRRVSNDGKEGTKVAIRMRPLNNNEGTKKRVWQVMPEQNAVHQTSKDGKLLDRIAGRTYFNYDKTFGEEVKTVEVYNDIAKPIVTSVVNGLNGTIFAYGQTSSGKTYTMQGSGSIEDGSHSGGGIVHMAVRDIFSHIKSQTDRMFLVRASFLEIYNEDVRDLLSNSTESLHIREDPRHGVFVQSIEETVTDFESLLEILFHGEKSRQVASTGMNERSSRSHTIFRITIESRENVEGSDGSEQENDSSENDGAVLVSTLNLVDLAGSESVRHTGASGDRQKEGGMINQSLLTLSRVIQALGTNQGHVNFRDSKLTRLLQSSLSGNAKMAVICCATPSELYLEETRSTLQFASRASLVKTNAQVNEVLDDRSMIKRLQRELAEAKKNSSAPGAAEIQAMEDKAAMESKAKIIRLTSCLLNGGHLFASTQNNENSMVSSPADVRMKLRKRRQSDGNFFAGIKSPLKLNQQIKNIAPLTEPRRKKTRQVQQQVSPKSHLNIVREALSSRSNFARSLQDTVSNMKFVIQNAESRFREEKESNDSKMSEFQRRYEALQQDHDQSQIDNAVARDENARLMDESAKVHEDYETMKKQNADLQQQLRQLLSDFDVQRQQSEAKINELETLRVEISEVERLLREEEEKAHEKDEQLAQSRDQLSKFEVEQESIREQLERQNSEFISRSEAQMVKTQSLQEEISRLQQEGDGLRMQLVESTTKIQETTTDKAHLEIKLSSSIEDNIELKRHQELLQEKISELNLTAEKQNTTIENLTAQNIEVQAKLETAETSLEDVEEELEISRADMSSRIESLEDKLTESATENVQAKQKLEEIIVEKDAMGQKISELTANIEEKHTLVQQLNTEKHDLEIKLGKAETSLEDTEETLKLTRSDMNSRIASLEEKLQVAEAETVRVKKEFDEMNTKKDELEGKVESCQEELESVSAENAALEDKLTKASEENSEFQNKTEQLETARSDMSSRIASLEEKLQVAEEENVRVKKELDEMNTKKDELEGELESCQEELESVSAENAALEDKLTKASEENSEFQNKTEQLETTRSDMSSRIASLEEKLQVAEEENAHVKKELDEMNTMKDELEGKLESCRVEHESLSTEKVALENKLTKALEENTEVLNRNQQLEEKSTELKASLQERQGQIEKLDTERSYLEKKLETTKASLEDSEERLEISRADMNSRMEVLEEKLKAAKSETAKVKEEMDETISKSDSDKNELEEKLVLTSKEKEQVEAKLADVGDEKAELQTQHQLLEEKLAEITFSVEQHKMEIEKLHSEKKNLESILDQAEKSLEDSEEQLEKTQSDMSRNLERLKEKLEAAEAEAIEVRQAFEESITEKDALHKELEDKLGSMIAEKKALEGKLLEMADEKTELLNQHQQLEEKIAEQTSIIEVLQSDVESVKSEKIYIEAKLKTTETSLHHSEEQLEITIADMSSKIDCLNEKLTESETELAQVKQELDENTTKHKADHQELHGKLDTMAEAKEQLKANLGKAGDEKERLQNELERLQEKIRMLESSLEEQKVEFDMLNSVKSDIESKLVSSETKAQESENKLTVLDADLRLAVEQKSLIEEKLNSELKEKEIWKMDIEKRKGDVDNELDSFRNEVVLLRRNLQNAELWKQGAVSEQQKYEATIKDLKSLLEGQKKDAGILSKEHEEVCQMLAKAKDDGCVLEDENLELWSNVSELGEKMLSLGRLLAQREAEIEHIRNHWYRALHENADAKVKVGISEEEIRSSQICLADVRKKLDASHDKIQSMELSNEKELLKKQEQIMQLQQVTDMANSKSETIAAELNAVVHDLNEQKSLNEALEYSRKELESRLSSVSIELDKLTTEKISMQADSTDAEGTILELTKKLAQAESTILQIRNSNQVIIAEQEEAYKELESRLKDLFQGLESLKDEKGDLEDQIMHLENEKRELQTTCGSLSNEKEEIDKLLEHATQDLSTNEEAISQATVTINDLQDRLKMSEEQLTEITMDYESKIGSLQERLASSLKEIDVLKSKKFDLETRIEELQSGLDCQLQTLQEKLLEVQSENEELRTQAQKVDVTTAKNRSEVMEIKTMTTAILAEKDAVEALLSESQLQAHQLEEQLDTTRAEHEKVLTNTALQLDEQQKKLEAMILARNEVESNLNKRLKDRELERDEATAELQKLYDKNRELNQSIATCVTKERESELVSEISDLKQENVELKQLLISANESEERGRKEVERLEMECDSKSRELDDAFYKLSQMEDELCMAQIPHERETDRSHEGLIAEIQEQKVELEKVLDRERMERQKAEENLKQRMGEEQRLLIHEAEEKFNELRNTASELETRLEQSESEGYQARQEAEELRDQNKEIEDKCIAFEGAVSNLKSFVTDQENKMSALQSELQKAKAESYGLKETVIEMKERARKASRESEKAMRENQISSGEVVALKRKISSLELNAAQQQEQHEHMQSLLRTARTEAADMDNDHQNAIKSKDEHIERIEARLVQLEGESKRLAVELRMAGLHSATQNAEEGESELHQKIEQLTAQMKKKDSRIKKLEQVRLTKEQVESIKKMKTDSIRLQEEFKRLTRKNSELLEQLESSTSSQPSSLELDKLRSDKQALEKKLMKYVSHCQSLMDDQASMMDALRSCNIHIENDSDPNDAVIALCEKYREAKRSQDISSENAVSAQLLKKNKVLVAQMKEMEDAERQFSSSATQYQKEIELLKGALANAKDDLDDTKITLKREISTLKEEALQAIQEKKAAKKKLQRVQSELEMMRMNASMENPTVDFTVSDLQLVNGADDSPLKPTMKERTSTRKTSSLNASHPKQSRPPLGDATNGAATLNQSGVTKPINNNNYTTSTNTNLKRDIGQPVPNSTSKPGLVPGLGEAGEAAMYDDENTQECKQS